MITTASDDSNHPSQRMTTQSQEDVSWTELLDPISHPMGQDHQTERKGKQHLRLFNILYFLESTKSLLSLKCSIGFSSVYFLKQPHAPSKMSLLIQVGKEWTYTFVYI